jgi:NAD(P)-dependent dehydrogenase (short-subunit alcohol dehydrogenase family)
MNIKESRVIVTGGRSGLGGACVAALKKQGAEVLSWDIKPVTDNSGIYCEVNNEASVKEALTQTIQKIGCPNVCIQCAGIATGKRVVGKHGALPLEEFKHVIDVNLIGSFNVLRLVAEQMIKHQIQGIFIQTASVAAFEGQIGQAAYSASKAGIVGMMLPIAREFAQHQIRVNTIAPGLMETPMMANMPPEVKIDLAKTVPYPQRLGKPEEYAQLAMHIIENDYLNGEVIRLDGALRMMAK